ncbi:MAG TPA: hypothetical protein VMS43_05905 [Allosphingosinicella sp.]|nr:hypothetical protein [Allosphingosinicella sp.]
MNTPDRPGFVEPLVSDCLTDTFPPGHRKPRHDGFTPEAVGGFLRHLAASGVVEHAADAVGLSASAAYAFRNRREGRAFARMWDAILIHRSRARIAAENQSRAINGCVSVRKRDGLVVSEYHYYDNRLATAVLTRLDRLAEKEADSEAHLRALSEDMDAFIDCVAEGGDLDAFVEARRPVEPGPGPDLGEGGQHEAEIDHLVRLPDVPDYRNIDPADISVSDLDPGRKESWTMDQWIRGLRSGFLDWLSRRTQDSDFIPGPGSPLRFRAEICAAIAAIETGAAPGGSPAGHRAGAEIDTTDLDLREMDDWTEEQWGRAHMSGILDRADARFWDELAGPIGSAGEEG